MRVLLRTASTLARACSEAAQRIDVRPLTRISVNQNALREDVLAAVASETMQSIMNVLELHEARAEIRRMIGEANQESVNRLLVERDRLNMSEKFLVDLLEQIADKGEGSGRRRRLFGSSETTMRVAHSLPEVTAALGNLRQRMQTVTTGDVVDYIEVPALPEAQVKTLQDRIAAIKRRRTAANDELAAANLNAHITLPDAVVAVLRKHQIVE